MRWSAAAWLLFLALPAGAQPVLDRTGKRAPAKKAELLFATRVTPASGLPLERVSRLEQPVGKPRPLAGRVLRGKGVRVDLAGLSVRRLRFGSADEAAAAASLLGRGARVDPKQPRCVTQALGPQAKPGVLARVESVATGGALPSDLAKTLSSTETAREADGCELRIPHPAIGFTGVEVRLKGLRVARLRFSAEADAARFVERRAAAARAHQVLDQVGSEVVLLSGSALGKVERATKVLARAWKAGQPPRGKRGVLGVWSTPTTFGRFCARNGPLYQEAADLVRRCRKAPTGITQDGLEWRFADAETHNDLRFRPKLARPRAEARYGGVLVTAAGLLHVRSAERGAPERRYVLGLLQAVGQRLELGLVSERVRLLAPKD